MNSSILILVAEAVLYQENDSGFFIKAVGHVTASVSTDLRELLVQRLNRDPLPVLLAADLSSCQYMDSTFMGLLVGFHKRYKSLTGKPLTILRPTDECIKLLQGLGILRLLSHVSGEEPPSPEQWLSMANGRSPKTEILLRAHRNLSELSPENEKQFSSLEEVLRRDLDKQQSQD